MKQLSVSQAWILGLLCTTLGVLLITIWSIGTRVEQKVMMQARSELERFSLPVLLVKDSFDEEYDRIMEDIAGVPGIRSATWHLDIPSWPGPEEEPEGWAVLWHTRVPPRATVHFDTKYLPSLNLWSIADRVGSITGVLEIPAPYSEWGVIASLRHYANTVGWVSRVTALVGGSVLVAVFITLMTLVGRWPHHLSPEKTRLAAAAIGMLWAILVAAWIGFLVTPAEVPRPPFSVFLFSGILGLAAINLLLPRGYQRVRRTSDRKPYREEW